MGEGSYGWLGLRMARPTAHLNQHLLQLPNTKLVHVNQCYIPGIGAAYTAGSLHMLPFSCSYGKRNGCLTSTHALHLAWWPHQ